MSTTLEVLEMVGEFGALKKGERQPPPDKICVFRGHI
jgi:hypothetical protein